MADFRNIPDTPTLGLGCWAIGGPFFAGDRSVGINPDTKSLTGDVIDPAALRQSIDASRTRLQRDKIDLILLYNNACPVADATPIFDMLDDLVADGVTGAHGWSTDFPDRLQAMAHRPHFTAVEHAMNVFFRAEHMVPAVEDAGRLALIRSPPAMGILGGRYDANATFDKGDIRGGHDEWNDYFRDGRINAADMAQLDGARDILRGGGRSLAQGALAWLWARSPNAVPIPGFRTVAQVSDLCESPNHGPLTPAQMAEIETILNRPAEGPPRAR